MSINIRQDIANISNIEIIVRPDRMGVRQFPSFKRMMTTGVITSQGLAGNLTEKVRRFQSLPTVVITGDTFCWADILPTSDAFFTLLGNYATALQLGDGVNKYAWYRESVEKLARKATDRCSSGGIRMCVDDANPADVIFKKYKLPPSKIPTRIRMDEREIITDLYFD